MHTLSWGRFAPVKALKSPTGSPGVPELAENAERSIYVTVFFFQTCKRVVLRPLLCSKSPRLPYPSVCYDILRALGMQDQEQ